MSRAAFPIHVRNKNPLGISFNAIESVYFLQGGASDKNYLSYVLDDRYADEPRAEMDKDIIVVILCNDGLLRMAAHNPLLGCDGILYDLKIRKHFVRDK